MVVWHGIVNALVTPPGVLLIGMAGGLAISRARPALGYIVIALSTAALWILSLPVTADALARDLETVPALATPVPAGPQAIVVLAAGRDRRAPEYDNEDTVGANTLVRLRYAASLYRQTGLPILASGGAPFGGRPTARLMRHVLRNDFHVPVQFVETHSRTTAGNARFCRALLRRAHIRRILLVTQAWHMPRAAALFRRQGFVVTPAPTDFVTTSRRDDTILGYLPSASALALSATVGHEELGLLWIHLSARLPRWLAAFINNP